MNREAGNNQAGSQLPERDIVYIGLGSNLGDGAHNLRQALQLLKQQKSLQISAVSGLYKTEPVGYTEQSWFFNAAAGLHTELEPRELLRCLQTIENKMGRVRTIRWGPRIIDLDILLFNDLVINEPDLIIPHPRMTQRAFALLPLTELEPNLCLPDGRPLVKLAGKLSKQQGIYPVCRGDRWLYI